MQGPQYKIAPRKTHQEGTHTRNTFRTFHLNGLQGTESEDWSCYSCLKRLHTAETKCSTSPRGSKARISWRCSTHCWKDDQEESFSGYSLQDEHVCSQWQAKITTIFGICFLPFAGHGVHAYLWVSIQQRAAPPLLQYASAMTEKKMQQVINFGAVFHIVGQTLRRGRKSILRKDAGIERTNLRGGKMKT